MFEAISFDCYGTLIDWETGITGFLARVFREKGVDQNEVGVFKAREDIEFEMIQGAYRTYKEILHESLSGAFKRFGLPYSDQDGDRLVESVPTWPVFPETKPALQKLASEHLLVIISNIDNDIIEKTKRRIGVDIQLTVTAQEARAYKPNTKPFELALRKLGCSPERVLHVSSGFKYDIPPAQRLGFKTAWINRKNEARPATASLDFEFNSLTELAESVHGPDS